jgi:hypothetical protein
MAAPVPPLVKKKKQKLSPWKRYWWVAGLAAVAAVAGAWYELPKLPRAARVELLPGYIPSVATVEQEYARFHGKLLHNPEVEQQFQNATELSGRHDYAGAVDMLEAASKVAAVPVIFNNLGVLYAKLNDRSRAINAFREALARDIDYQPVRLNLQRLKGFTQNDADPVTREIEPNNSNLLANLISLGSKPVDAEIAAGQDDVDCFKFTSPPAPRDILSIHIESSPNLAPGLRVYDSDMRVTKVVKDTHQPGTSLTQLMAPAPNTTLYLNVFGMGGTGGPYTVTIQPTKSYDSYEPNDDIYSARTITVGQTIQANIMDGQDTDYYTFVSPRTGTVSIDIRSRSTTLIPALTTFTPDMRNNGFGPDIRTPGASLHHTIQAEEGRSYYVQVWSQASSFGEYVLKIE